MVEINFFDVKNRETTRNLIRRFRGRADEFTIGRTAGVSGVSWPVFR